MTIETYGDPLAETVLIQPVDEHELSLLKRETEEIGRLCGKKFCLYAYRIEDWNRELSPWKAPAVFGKEDFGDGAADTLKQILALCGDESKRYILGGYSLAGLFSLWAAAQTDRFAAIAAVSPSLWFPGFTDYLKANGIRSRHVYLSLGDREEKTRNPLMATVGERMRESYDFLKEKGIDCVLEWNEGNHFKDSELRTAKGFARALGACAGS